MPCTDGGVPYPPSREEVLQRKMPAALCGIINAIRKQTVAPATVWIHPILQSVDWAEAGVTLEEVREWFLIHDRRDQERRRREAERNEKARLKQEFQASLTPQQIEMLKKL